MKKGVLDMSKKSYIFCFVVFIIFFIMVYFTGKTIVKTDEDNKNNINEVNVAVEDNEKVSDKNGQKQVAGYWIKTDNNYIVIYNNKGEIITNTEISDVNFSDTDKQILKEGIYVETAEDLFRYLESYTS